MTTCGWCDAGLVDVRARYCSKRCRQTAHRARRRAELFATGEQPIRVAYADPPYPGLAARYYSREATYGGEVDHRELVARLVAGWPDGWALSTSAAALRDVLPLCPEGTRVCAWSKPHGIPSTTMGLHNVWEPLLVWRGRQLPPGVRDHLSALPARGGGELVGRKPLAFVTWMFACLGLQPGDVVDDLYPGTGIVGRTWAAVSSGAPGDASVEAFSDTSRAAAGDGCPDDPSPRGMGDTSQQYSSDGRRCA